MVTVSDIQEPEKRFLSKEKFEEIKSNIQRLPEGDYWCENGVLKCGYEDNKGNHIVREIAKILHPGCVEAFVNCRSNLSDLATHVEQADRENDTLIAKLEKGTVDVKTPGN